MLYLDILECVYKGELRAGALKSNSAPWVLVKSTIILKSISIVCILLL